ncbi:MAG: AAA family ATPase [Spirochaetota bacterium]|nr:AAA family ATPase [Spirochaetota bacterium]
MTTLDAIEYLFRACLDVNIGADIKQIIHSLSPEDFEVDSLSPEENRQNKLLFSAIKSTWDKLGEVDPYIISQRFDYLKGHYAFSLPEDSYIAPTSVRNVINDSIKKLKSNSFNRKKKKIFGEIEEIEDPQEIIDRIENNLQNLKGELVYTIIEPAFSKPEIHLQEDKQGIITGYNGIDSKHGLYGLKGFTIIGGTPKSWKSTVTFNIAWNISTGIPCYQDEKPCDTEPIPVLYIDFENGLSRLLRRKLSELLEIDYFMALEKYIPTDKRGDYQDFLEDVKGNTHFYSQEFKNLVVSRDKLELSNVKRFLNTLRKKHNSERVLLVIDSLQKLPLPSLSDRRASIDLWLRELETLKKTEAIDIIAVSELSRSGYNQDNKNPNDITSNHFKESGDIEYTAENLLALHRVKEKVGKDWKDVKPDGYKAVLGLKSIMNRDNDPISPYLSFFEVGQHFNLEEVSYNTDKIKYEEYKNIAYGKEPTNNPANTPRENGNGRKTSDEFEEFLNEKQ